MTTWISRLLSRFLPAPPEIGPDEDVELVDVRTAREFASGHATGAHHIPHDQMGARWKELRAHRKKRLLVYCRTGRRSGIAIRILRQNGFTRAENAGGIGALRRAGIDIVR
jgi:phage shock protein E